MGVGDGRGVVGESEKQTRKSTLPAISFRTRWRTMFGLFAPADSV